MPTLYELAILRSDAHKNFVREMCDREGHTIVIFDGLWTHTTKPSLLCKDGHTWNTTTVNGLKTGKRCPTCAKLNPSRAGGRKGLGKDEWVKLAEEKAEQTGIKFLGVVENWTNAKGKVRLECGRHGVWESSSMAGFVASQYGNCNACGRERELASRHKDCEYYINKVLEVGKLDDRYIICSGGSKDTWYVKCTTCTNDVIGLSKDAGVFKTTFSLLRQGRIPCRCSMIKGLTEEDYIVFANGLLNEPRYECIGYSANTRRFTVRCKEHGEWRACRSGFIAGSRCPSCSVTGFDAAKPSIFYVLTISNGCDKFIGYGISNYYKKRLKVHKTYLHKEGYFVEQSITFSCEGKTAASFEKLVKKMLPLYNSTVTGFRTESTFVENKEILLLMASKMEDYISQEISEELLKTQSIQ